MDISEEIRKQVIEEYEAQRNLEKCRNKAKTKPLGRAQQYFRLLTMRYGSLSSKGWRNDVNELVKREICNKYGLTKVTELRAEDYNEANEYAIELFTKETEERGYQKNNIVDIVEHVLPWVMNRFTGRLEKTKVPRTWEEWKEKCYKEVH